MRTYAIHRLDGIDHDPHDGRYQYGPDGRPYTAVLSTTWTGFQPSAIVRAANRRDALRRFFDSGRIPASPPRRLIG